MFAKQVSAIINSIAVGLLEVAEVRFQLDRGLLWLGQQAAPLGLGRLLGDVNRLLLTADGGLQFLAQLRRLAHEGLELLGVLGTDFQQPLQRLVVQLSLVLGQRPQSTWLGQESDKYGHQQRQHLDVCGEDEI